MPIKKPQRTTTKNKKKTTKSLTTTNNSTQKKAPQKTTLPQTSLHYVVPKMKYVTGPKSLHDMLGF